MQLAECTRMPLGGRQILPGFLAALVEIGYNGSAALLAAGRGGTHILTSFLVPLAAGIALLHM